MHENGTVISIEHGDAVVRVEPGEQCVSCPQRGGCHSKLDLGLASRETRIEAANSAGARVGDLVEVFIPEQQRLRAGLVAFVLPVVLAVAGAVFGGLSGPNLGTGIGVGSGLVLGIIGAVVIDRLMDRRPDTKFRISKVLSRDAKVDCH